MQSEANLQENNGRNKQPLKVSKLFHENSRTAHASADSRTNREVSCVTKNPSRTGTGGQKVNESSRTAHASAGSSTNREGNSVAKKPSPGRAGTDPVMLEVRLRC